MCKLAYIFDTIDDNSLAWIKEYGCERILTDKAANEQSRPKLRQAIKQLQTGDEFIIAKFSNAVRGIHEMYILMEICRLKGVRLISINDSIDSWNSVFQEPSSSSLLKTIGSLSMEVNNLRRRVEIAKPGVKPELTSNKKAEKLKRNVRVINMYLAGHSLQGICSQMKICRTLVYNILRRNGIPYRRKSNGE